MPTYVFESEDGSQVERVFAVADCPGFVMVSGARYRKIVPPVSCHRVGDSMMEDSDFDRKFGKGAAALMASDRDHRRKTMGPERDHGFKGPEWLRP